MVHIISKATIAVRLIVSGDGFGLPNRSASADSGG
jgi:hypothetical protein